MNTYGLETSLLEQSLGSSMIQAAAIVAVVGFLVWNLKLTFERVE